ncbi:barstar family protein [Paenarthrobacter ureafaciens]|jgi:RNAse (barnase) inhibitor barstar|uniref:barstar family protein n=1 Tax=Paenarthrobacter ureafaciens TaxID=37931 RepID=UPI001408E55E|nr:barstar family protein [Paenarthrobacter ureafaciens]MCX8455870.1 barstar family protein [Paenarthrobacter ureafaciens]MCY0975416.1 barstar family protein [Paenarthrobacter ureafaciens]
MAIWDLADELNHPLDFLLIQNGFISLFHQQAILDDATSWLRKHGYKVVEVDAAAWQSQADLHQDVARALNFPYYYGSSFDALNDCLGDVAVQAYGWTAADTGLVLVIDEFEAFEGKDASTAHHLLDIFARQATYAALFGHRMMCLVRTGDPHLELPPVGGLPVAWNHREFLSAR